MSFAVKTKKPLSDDKNTDNNTTKSAELKCNQSEPSTSYEVFRNNTTAVEVIVKDVMNRNKKKILLEPNVSIPTIRRLHDEVESLQYQLAKSNSTLVKSRNGYRLIILELKKQLDAVDRQEGERQKENLSLLLENEKLKATLELKTNLVGKFKKELNGMRRVLKMVIKNITRVPQIIDPLILSSDPEFDDFGEDYKNDMNDNDIPAKIAPHIFEGMGTTFDSTLSKNPKECYDKHF